MQASNSRRFIFILAVLVLATAGSPVLAGLFEIAPVQPPYPTSCNEVTITISGLWPDSCVPDDSQITVIGHDIYFDAFHHTWLDMGCFHVLTDWSLTESVGPLSSGHYTVHVTLYEYPEGEDPYPLENGVTEFDVVVGARPIGDLDRNCCVDWADFAIFADHWLETGCQYLDPCRGTDLDQSRCVNWGDFSVFAAHMDETGCSEPDWCGGADFDHSGEVDGDDLWILSQHYGQCGCVTNAGCGGADLDASGTVDWSDFSIFAAHWAECAGVGCVPEMSWQIGQCTGQTAEPAQDLDATRFSITVEGQYIHFEDLIEANCCNDGIELEMTVDANLITVYEIEYLTMPCRCLCDYPATATLGPLADGTYTVEVIDPYGAPLGSVQVTIGG